MTYSLFFTSLLAFHESNHNNHLLIESTSGRDESVQTPILSQTCLASSQSKKYKVFNKALVRIQNDSQVRVRIGSPITGYGQESRNRAARQRIPNRVWKDDEGVEHVEVNFYIRGPHGAGKVFAEMFKDKEDRQWKFMYLQVEISSPSQSRMLLESYLPA